MNRSVSIVFFCLALIGFAGCVPMEVPEVETGHASEHEGCEVKGSGAYNPCLKGESVPASGEATKSQPQFRPSQCETGPQAMGPVFGAMLSGTLDELQDYCTSIGYGPDGSSPSDSYSSESSDAGGQGCANPFGGNSAPHGQYICSDRGEIQACQCSGGQCSLIPTGSFLCTSPGAVIR